MTDEETAAVLGTADVHQLDLLVELERARADRSRHRLYIVLGLLVCLALGGLLMTVITGRHTSAENGQRIDDLTAALVVAQAQINHDRDDQLARDACLGKYSGAVTDARTANDAAFGRVIVSLGPTDPPVEMAVRVKRFNDALAEYGDPELRDSGTLGALQAASERLAAYRNLTPAEQMPGGRCPI